MQSVENNDGTETVRLVVDTNVMIRALLSQGPARRFFMSAPLDHLIVYHARQVAELRAVAARPRLAITPEAVDELVRRIERYGVAVEVELEAIGDCRDPHDDYVLSLAHAGLADAIVTEDKDLLVLHPWRGVEILRLTQFLENHGVAEA